MATDSTPIFERIRRCYNQLSDARSKVARFILEHWDEAAFMPAAKLGEAVGVSETVVIRLASELGYSGYPEMQEQIKLHAIAMLQSAMVKRFDSQSVPGDYDSLLAISRDRIIGNIESVFKRNSPKVIMDAARSLVEAKNRFVIGLRASYGPAACLAINLNQMLGSTSLIDLGAGDSYDRLRGVTSQDLAVGITFHRYSAFTYDLLKIVKDRGGKIIAITDDLVAPISGGCPVHRGISPVTALLPPFSR